MKNFSETAISVLVILVISIQTRFIIMAILIGCLVTSLSNFPTVNSFKKNRHIIPTSNGSVGRLIPTPSPISSILIANGVKNTVNNSSLSKDKNANRINKSTTGTILNK